MCAFAFIWAYIQKGLFLSILDGVTTLDKTAASVFLLFAAVAASVVFAIGSQRFEKVLSRKYVVLGIGALGSIAIFFTVAVFDRTPGDPVSASLTLLCLSLQGISFCAVFLAWILEVRNQLFQEKLGTVMMRVLCGAAICFLIAPSWMNGSDYLQVIDTVGLAAAGICFAALGPHRCITTSESEPSALSIKMRALLMLLFGFFLLISLLSFTTFLIPGHQKSSSEDFVSYTLLFITIAVMMLFALYSNQNRTIRQRGLVTVTLCLVVMAFFALFVVAFAVFTQSEFCYSLVHFIKRVARICMFVILATMMRHYRFSPLRAFGLVFLVPVFLSKLLQIAFSSILAGSFLAISPLDNYMAATVLCIGFFMTLCLILFSFFNINGSIVGILLPKDHEAVTAHGKSADRSAAIDAIGRRYSLTAREKDIVYYFSLGYSAQKVSQILFISTNTVNTHAMSAYRKMDVHSRQEIIEIVDAECIAL